MTMECYRARLHHPIKEREDFNGAGQVSKGQAVLLRFLVGLVGGHHFYIFRSRYMASCGVLSTLEQVLATEVGTI